MALLPARFTFPFLRALAAVVMVLCLAPVAFGAAAPASIPLPPPLDKTLDVVLGTPPAMEPGNTLGEAGGTAKQRPRARPKPRTPENVLPVFLGIPYRQDGVINDAGKYATFNNPETVLPSPGLNCSGLVLAASRILLERNIPLREAVRDRENDSGPTSPNGHDWDFGFDLIMNISDGAKRTLLAPEGQNVPERPTGKTAPAFDPHDDSFTSALFPRVRYGAFYLVSFSRSKKPGDAPHLHYHVGLMLRDANNAVWLYSTTTNSRRVLRFNLTSEEGLARFRHSFRNTKNSYKRLVIVEVAR